MKTPAEYVAAARTDWPDGTVSVVPLADAEAAVAAALADAEKYRTLLLRAVRNAQQLNHPAQAA